MPNKQKLELTWIGKENRSKLEPRILIEDPNNSHHATHKHSENDIFDNKLIHGDNLLALKALEHEYAGKVKCIYIDPPYNTGSAFEHYDDGIEHSLWLSLMRERLSILRNLLAEEGSIWISIDDNEMAYLRIMMDEIFGRNNFICTIIWQKVYTVKNSARHLSDMHDYIIVFAKNSEIWRPNLLPRSEKSNKDYLNSDDDVRGKWTTNAIQARNFYSKGSYEIISPSGQVFTPPEGTYWRISEENFNKFNDDNRIWWGKNGNAIPRIKKFLSEAKDGIVPATMWFYSDVGHNAEAKIEVRELFAGSNDIFITPKPERLLQRILHIATNPGDLVLDSFLGSGTTAAVAHKMGRKWIGIELGDHCYTHCIPRLQKVINGEDPGGITKAVDWKGGGGFRFYELGPSLIKEDKWGNPVINPEFNPSMLSEVMCKLEGFSYQPNKEVYWMQGTSTETDFVYVTTQFITAPLAEKISEDIGTNRSLLICCSAFNCSPENYPNLTIKKIPKTVLKKCEWDHDDYSLAVENLPDAPPQTTESKEPRKFGKSNSGQMDLFGTERIDSEK